MPKPRKNVRTKEMSPKTMKKTKAGMATLAERRSGAGLTTRAKIAE